jgi:hypothetical protein
MANPGAASSSFGNFVLDPQNAYRLIAFAKNVNVAAAGDTPMTVITPSGYAAAQVVTVNSPGSAADVHLATVGIYTAPAQGGTTLLTTAALTGQTTAAFAYVRAATNPSVITNTPNLYVNVGTTVASGIVDVMLYGYDVQN